MRAGAVITPGDNNFRPRFVGDVDTWEEFYSGDGTVYSPGASGFTNPGPISNQQIELG